MTLGIKVTDSHLLGKPSTQNSSHFSFLDRRTQRHSSWPQTHSAAQEGLELVILLTQLSKDLGMQTCATRPASWVLFKWLFHAILGSLHFFGERQLIGSLKTQGMAENNVPRPSSTARDGGKTKAIGKKNRTSHGNHKFRAKKEIFWENKDSVP